MSIAATLNEHFRDALVAYFLGEVVPNDATMVELELSNKLRTPNDLYEYLLLDTQVIQAVETSPVASAIASLQQYINAVIMGMEPGYDAARFDESSGSNSAVLAEWRDMRCQYPLWAANQQLAWYPSLYIDPSLRMKKSAYFQQLENDINQNRITLDTTQEAVKSYLASFEEVANLTIINGYIAGTDFAESTYYFIGKSRAEQAYYWRSVNMAERSYREGTEGPKHDNPQPGAWSDWKKANLPISDAAIEPSIRPVYFNNRLFVIWADVMTSFDNTELLENWDGQESLPKPHARTRLRLHLTYKKYDDSWSAPQCYIDVKVNWAAISGPDGNVNIDTVASVDASSDSAGLFIALYSGFEQGESSDGSADRYRLLRTVKLDKNFNARALFPDRGLVDEGRDPDLSQSRLPVLRTGRIFALTNKDRFQFPATAAIRLKPTVTTSPHPSTSGVNGWNQNDWRARINQPSTGHGVTYDRQTNQVSFSREVATAFPSAQTYTFTLTATGVLNYVITLVVPAPIEHAPNSYLELTEASTLTTSGGPLSVNNRCSVSAGHPDGQQVLLNDTGTLQDQRVTLDGRTGLINLAGKYVSVDMLTYWKDLFTSGGTTTFTWLDIGGLSSMNASTLVVHNGFESTLVSPRISRRTSPTLGTAEFIDFESSTLAQNDQNIAARAPIRMNTLFARNLIERANIALENLLSWDTQLLPEPAMGNNSEQPPMDFKGANGLYFWELFFHLPFMISHRLNLEQQFKEAEYWLSFIFDPSRKADHKGRPDYWNVRPLLDDPSRDHGVRKPQDPDGIASDNPVHYRKAAYNHYIRNLLSQGDAAYRQLTPDALNEAKLWYVRVLDLLGPRPDKRLVSGWNPVTLQALANSVNPALRAFEQRLIEQEQTVAQSAADNEGRSLISVTQPPLQLMPFDADSTVPELDSPYFRVAMNRELVQHWDTAEARLRNLRKNRSLDGKPLQLPLFAAPLDPRALMAAYGSAALGGGLARLLGQEIPHYRFNVMHNLASNAVENLIQFGNTLLSLLERKENAEMQVLQQQHVWAMAKEAVLTQQRTQAMEAKSRDALLGSQAVARGQLGHYEALVLEVVNAGEVAAAALALTGQIAHAVGVISRVAGHGLKISPNHAGTVAAVITPAPIPPLPPLSFGGAVVGQSVGGQRLEATNAMAAAIAFGTASASHGTADALDRTEQFRRRHQQWKHARDQAQLQIDQIDAQLVVHDAQVLVTAQQLRQSQLAVEQAEASYQFLSKRFTQPQLYQWLNAQFATFYYQAYDTALSLCLAAEACWQFEVTDFKTRFIQAGGWKDGYRGLTAGESLRLGLMKMETAYLQRTARQSEINKTVSVRHLLESGTRPWAAIVNELNGAQGLEIELTQALFDRDYAGQYARRIQRVSLTLPAALGPYQDLCAVLTQTYSKVQLSETADENVLENLRATQQIALSSGTDDEGGLTLNFDEERYRPFEGTGAVSKWNLKFTRPATGLEQSLHDVILRLSYTARS